MQRVVEQHAQRLRRDNHKWTGFVGSLTSFFMFLACHERGAVAASGEQLIAFLE